MAQDPYKYFRPEARDLVDQFAKGVLELEKGAGGETATAVQRLLRIAHTLKGAARVVKQSEIANRAHQIEDTLAPFREAPDNVGREHIDILLSHLDDINSRLVTLVPADDADRAAPAKPVADERTRTVRADVAETDAVLDGVAEAHALLAGLRNASDGVTQARHLADLLLSQLGPHGVAGRERRTGRHADQLLATAEAMRRKFTGVERNLGFAVDQMDRELRQLRDAAERLRLGSAGTLFVALERTARDSARALSKQVTFEAKGGEIRLDSHVIETLQGALIQLTRNAVAHGIETESERKALGKPAAGRITVTITRRARHIVFECRDDGRGIDVDAVRRIAAERGGPGKTGGVKERPGKEHGAEDVVRMLLRGGISTSKTVTDVSGRGVGLDVVREAIERLGGEVALRTERGVGTTFELIVPPSIAAVAALMVVAGDGGRASAIPLDAVRGTMRVLAEDISRAAPGASILFEGKAIPFIPLQSALDRARWPAGRGWTAVMIAGSGGLAAIGVDRLLGTAQIVSRPLPEQLAASPIVAGAALDGESNPQLVLDPDGLVAAAQRGQAGDVGEAATCHPVLVIDDSLTTRMLEQSILESAGYEVDVALSGEEALEILRRKTFALILVDVEMPGIDGFTFIERIRDDAQTRHIPAILVTSRAAPEDLQRGRDVGANGHIVKSEFDQAELLTMIKSMIG
jgi:two-component system, chemotaxis family, sensor kinase CheA